MTCVTKLPKPKTKRALEVDIASSGFVADADILLEHLDLKAKAS